jgi:solute carrier family 25 carnitine/acylcarnitine transporter 20/29
MGGHRLCSARIATQLPSVLIRHGMTESTPGKDVQRLTLIGHGIAGLGAGLTRFVFHEEIWHWYSREILTQRSDCDANGNAQRCGLNMSLFVLSTLPPCFLVRLQLQLERSSSDRQFKNPIDCARQVMRTQGIPGLWTGFTGSLVLRSNFFWMFLSFEVRGLSPICELNLEFINVGLHEKLFETSGDAV